MYAWRSTEVLLSTRLQTRQMERRGSRGAGGGRVARGRSPRVVPLLADAEPPDEIGVTLGVLGLHVIEQAAALADELQEPTSRMVILGV